MKVNRSLSQGFCSCCESRSRKARVAIVRAHRRGERQDMRAEVLRELEQLEEEHREAGVDPSAHAAGA